VRLLIRSMVLTSIFVFTIQPSAKAEVASSGTYWQQLPNAIKEKQQKELQHFFDVVHWNEVVAWNEAVAAQKTIPMTSPEPKVESDPVSQSGDRFDRLANCESGMRQDAVSSNGLYLSYFQWLISTWHSVGGTGDPRNHSYEEQKEKAKVLASQANPGTQWPVCWYR
jgi:hypothetical protein